MLPEQPSDKEFRYSYGIDWDTKDNQIAELTSQLAESQDLNTAQAKKIAMLDTLNRHLEVKIAELKKELEEAHSVLDADQSRIIRNAKDGYPEGRPDRILTLAERVKAICRYASDYKRWNSENEEKIESLEARIKAAVEIVSSVKEMLARNRTKLCEAGLSMESEEYKLDQALSKLRREK